MQTSTTASHILIFDSGAGGLSIAKKIFASRPHSHISYAADNDFYPYGLKSDTELTERIIQQVGTFYKLTKPDLVVIACNTASTLVLDTLREHFPCPFVGVVPAIKPAAKLSQSGVIGVLATPATVLRPYTQQLIDDHAPSHQVILHGSDILVDMAEQKLRGQNIDLDKLESEINELFQKPHGNSIDAIALACTHFPLLCQEFEAISSKLGKAINWIDSSDAIARRVDFLLKPDTNQEKPHIQVLLSQDTPKTAALKQLYLNYLEY